MSKKTRDAIAKREARKVPAKAKPKTEAKKPE